MSAAKIAEHAASAGEKIIITGATGNAGSGILTAALASPLVSGVTVISRKPPYITHPKLTTILLAPPDYPEGFDVKEVPSSLLEKLKGHSAVIWALGISQTQVNQQDYIKITHDYTDTFARAFSSLGTNSNPFRFVFVSGEGADQSEKGRALFSRIKGRTEKELKAMETDSFRTISVRPGGILPMPEHREHMSTLLSVASRVFGAIFNTVYPKAIIDSADLGVACVEIAAGKNGKGWDKRTEQGWLPNTVLRELAEELKRAG